LPEKKPNAEKYKEHKLKHINRAEKQTSNDPRCQVKYSLSISGSRLFSATAVLFAFATENIDSDHSAECTYLYSGRA